MNKTIKDIFPSDDYNVDIDCCPICSSDEFLLSDDHALLICIDCGPVPVKAERNITTANKIRLNGVKSIATLH